VKILLDKGADLSYIEGMKQTGAAKRLRVIPAYPAYYYWDCPKCRTENEHDTCDTGTAKCDKCGAEYDLDIKS